MTGTIAHGALVVALLVAVYGTIASAWGGHRGHRALVGSGRNAAYLVLALTTLAVGLMAPRGGHADHGLALGPSPPSSAPRGAWSPIS